MNNTVRNTGTQITHWVPALSTFGYVPRSRIIKISTLRAMFFYLMSPKPLIAYIDGVLMRYSALFSDMLITMRIILYTKLFKLFHLILMVSEVNFLVVKWWSECVNPYLCDLRDCAYNHHTLFPSNELFFFTTSWNRKKYSSFLRYNWQILLCKFEIKSVMIWYTHVLQNIYHNKVN